MWRLRVCELVGIRLTGDRNPISNDCLLVSSALSTFSNFSFSDGRKSMRNLLIARPTLAVSVLVFVLLYLAGKANADTIIEFNASGTFADGSSLSGTVTIDTTIGVATAADLTVVGNGPNFDFIFQVPKFGVVPQLFSNEPNHDLIFGVQKPTIELFALNLDISAIEYIGIVLPVSLDGYSGGPIIFGDFEESFGIPGFRPNPQVFELSPHIWCTDPLRPGAVSFGRANRACRYRLDWLGFGVAARTAGDRRGVGNEATWPRIGRFGIRFVRLTGFIAICHNDRIGGIKWKSSSPATAQSAARRWYLCNCGGNSFCPQCNYRIVSIP